MEDARAYKCWGTKADGERELFAVVRVKDMASAIDVISLMPKEQYQAVEVALVPVESLR